MSQEELNEINQLVKPVEKFFMEEGVYGFLYPFSFASFHHEGNYVDVYAGVRLNVEYHY